MKFVDEGSKLRRQARKIAARTPASLPGGNASSYLMPDKHDFTNDLSIRPPYTQRGAILYRHPSPSRLESDQIISSFVSAMFPLGAASVQKSFVGSWLWHVPSRIGLCAALDHAALSLALAYFARLSGDSLVLQKSNVSYTSALKSLATAIADATRASDSTVLCATLLLQFYEEIVTNHRAWICHAGGAARLMQLRGARRSYDSAFEYSMFLACRGAIIAQALASEEPCFLEAPEWQSIPDGLIEFPLLPDSSDLHHLIFGHFAVIPGILNNIKQLTDDTPDACRRSLLQKSKNAQQDIKDWYTRYVSTDNRRTPTSAALSPSPIDDHHFQCAYTYKDIASACIITAYYAYLILLNKGIDRLQSNTQSAYENFHLARDICMSANYCSQSGHCGTQTMVFSLPAAHSALPVKYHGWIAAQMTKFSTDLDAARIQTSRG